MDYTDILRGVNVVLALIAVILVGRNLFAKWTVRKPRMRLMSMSLLALLLVVVEGSLEQIHLHTPFGPRAVLTTAACLWIVIAWVITPDDYSENESTDVSRETFR